MYAFTRNISKLSGVLRANSASISAFPNSFIKDEVARCSLPPTEHDEKHIGMWYTIDPERFSTLYGVEPIEPHYSDFPQVFNEFSLMIRKPSIEIINTIKNSAHIKHPLKFILYGRRGSGKTFTLYHLVDYFAKDYVVIHFAKLYRDVYDKNELAASREEGKLDHIAVATRILQHFKSLNKEIVKKLNLQTVGTYEWNARETTHPGDLMNLVDFGIQRSRYSCECLGYLFKELKRLSTDKQCKLAVVIDTINVLYTAFSKERESGKILPMSLDTFTYFESINNLFQRDWENGVIIGAVDEKFSPPDLRKSDKPRYLLSGSGWNALDPFIPVKVDFYNDLEFRSALLYYNDRQWLQHPSSHTEDGYYEIEAMTSRSPYETFEFLENK